MKYLAIIAAASLLTACAGTGKTVYTPQVKQISQPPIGSVNTANLGDKLLVQGMSVERQALHLETPHKMLLGVTAHSGYYPKNSENAEYVFFGSSRDIGAGKVTDAFGIENAMPNVLALRKSDNAICGVNALGGVVGCKPGTNFAVKNWLTANSSSFQQTLLYNGKVGNKINIAYREFSSDLARPAFNNDVEYDLSESNQIGYKGAILEVLDANNQSIKYKVIKNFNTAE